MGDNRNRVQCTHETRPYRGRPVGSISWPSWPGGGGSHGWKLAPELVSHGFPSFLTTRLSPALPSAFTGDLLAELSKWLGSAFLALALAFALLVALASTFAP